MQVGILWQDGRIYAVYDSGDYAADEAKRQAKANPQYHWTWTYNTVLTTPKVETKA